MKLLGLSGSIRKESSNLGLLRAMAKLAPAGVEFAIDPGLDRLPYFDPDLDGDFPPAPVREFRSAIADAHAIVVSTPEYAHGIPGVLKNALDWLVGDPLFAGKRVGLVYGSAGEASHARESLREILRTMSANLVDEATTSIAAARGKIAADGATSDDGIRAELARVLGALARD